MILLIILSTILAGSYWYSKPSTENMSYVSFLEAVDQRQVDTVTLSDTGATFETSLKNDKNIIYTVSHPKTDNFIEFLLLNDIAIKYQEDHWIINGLRLIFIAIIAIGILWFSRRNSSNQSLIIDAKKKEKNSEPITLNKVAGNAEAKSMVEDIIDFIRQPEKYAAVGARMPKGLLFYGPPGTGKTLMAKAIAGEANVPFYAMSGSDFVQMYVGVGASRIRSLFQKAKKNEKAVIFIDEIDAIGKKRGRSVSASNDERDQTLNALLTEMSGFNDNQGIVVIGATNRIDTLDEALLRPGRFDRQIEIGLPDINSRKKILSLYTKDKPMADDVDLDSLAKSTVYFSGAMLENLLNEAAILAANGNQSAIRQEEIDRAFYTVIAGAPRKDRSYISGHDKKVTAYHEAGHALVTKLLLPEHYISKVTIIPSVKGAGGFNLSIPKDTLYRSKRQLLASIQVLLAGRAAEELIFGEEEITTGASNDIQKASSQILEYLNKFGMDQDLGLFSIDTLESSYDEKLIKKCRELMKELYQESKQLLYDNIDLLEDITEHLLERESLSGEDIQQISSNR